MKIDSYEQYHIGSKLNPAIDFNAVKYKLKNKLKSSGYSVMEQIQVEQTFLRVPIELLAVKDDVRIEHNILPNALNIIGTNVNNVVETFKEIVDILNDIEIPVSNLVIFLEILTSIIVKTDRKPLDLLSEKINLDAKKFVVSDVQNLGVSGIQIRGSNDKTNSLLFINIEPYPANPDNKFKVNLQYQTKAIENVFDFSKEVESNVINLLEQFNIDQ